MDRTIHLVDAGEGASPLLASALAASMRESAGACVVALGSSAGRALLLRGGLRLDGAASAPAGILRLAARPLRRTVMSACGTGAPAAVTCWSAIRERADALCSCARGALPGRVVAVGDVHALAQSWRGDMSDAHAQGAVQGGLARDGARRALGAPDSATVVLGLADAPAAADAHRMLDVAGRAMLAGADARLLLAASARGIARTLRYARGLGLGARIHVMEGAESPGPWWSAADVALVCAESPLVAAACDARHLAVVDATGEGRAGCADARDRAASELIAHARKQQGPGWAPPAGAPAQSRMNASAASA